MVQGADVVVIGAGAAGLSAAVSAAEEARRLGAGLRILVIERGGEDSWGGNSRYTGSNWFLDAEEVGGDLVPKLPNDFIEKVKADSRGLVDERLLRVFAENVVDTVMWVKSMGVRLEARQFSFTMIRPMIRPRIGPVGGGYALINALRRRAEELGVGFILRTTAYRLSTDDNGVVNGVWVRGPDGRSRRIGARAVIIATGGFEGNYEVLSRYVRNAVYLKPDVPATLMHMGEAISMAVEVGAKLTGQFNGFHGSIVDARAPEYRQPCPEYLYPSCRRLVMVYPYGILVNKFGRRFVDEGMDIVTESFEVVARAISEQPDGVAYLILDQKIFRIEDYRRGILTELPPIEADTMEELADKIGVPRDELVRTVSEFNKAVQDGPFDPRRRDGKRTVGIEPPKSNWALRIDEPPFLCYPVTATIQFTWGGLAIDGRARVLATNDAPIPGLYAAGEVTGFYYHHYTGGTSVLRALVFGRIAGREAVRYVLGVSSD